MASYARLISTTGSTYELTMEKERVKHVHVPISNSVEELRAGPRTDDISRILTDGRPIPIPPISVEELQACPPTEN